MIKNFENFLNEEGKGLWHNIRAKRARGEKPARKGSKAYKKAVKAARELKESFKTIGLPDPTVEIKPGIEFYASPKMVKTLRSYDDSPIEDIVEGMVNFMNLVKGEIFIDEEEFVVSGVTRGGNIIYIEQPGEYNMYGGPYDPKMERPEVTINGKDRVDFIVSYISEETGEEYSTSLGSKKYPDFMRVDIYGALLDKPESFFTAQKYGL